MTLFSLVWAIVRRRPVTWTFHVLLLAVAVALTVAVLLVRQGADARLAQDLAGIDLVVGADGSPLQLVMSAVFQADAPTGNIPLAIVERLERDPLVARAVPVSLGDSLGTYRIVGTTKAFGELYGASLSTGCWWEREMDAVLGSAVASRLGLRPGDTFVGSHGLEPGAAAHDDYPYRVVGLLKPTGTVADRVVLTDLSSVWSLHQSAGSEPPGDDEAHANHDDAHHEAEARQVTAVLVQYRSVLGAVVLPARLDRLPGIQAASPAREAQRLTALIGDGAQLMIRLGQSLLVLAVGGFVMALTTAVLARRRELALLTALGAKPMRLSVIVVLESALLGLAGGALGLLMGRAIAWSVSRSDIASLPLAIPAFGVQDASVLAIALGLSVLAALPAALVAVRTDPVRVLQGDR